MAKVKKCFYWHWFVFALRLSFAFKRLCWNSHDTCCLPRVKVQKLSKDKKKDEKLNYFTNSSPCKPPCVPPCMLDTESASRVKGDMIGKYPEVSCADALTHIFPLVLFPFQLNCITFGWIFFFFLCYLPYWLAFWLCDACQYLNPYSIHTRMTSSY